MKKHISLVFTLMILGTVVFLSSCEDSNDPTIDDREKYLGLWKASSFGPGGDVNFNMTITASNSDENGILMENFDALGSGTFVIGSVSDNSIFIPSILVGSDTVQGNGTYNSDKTLSFNYQIRDGQTVENRTATARR